MQHDQADGTGSTSAPGTGLDRALLDVLVGSAPMGFAHLDRDLRVVRVNDVLAATVGRPADEQVGRRVAELLPHLWPRLGPLVEEIVRTGRPVVGLPVVRDRPDGTVVHELVSAYPVRVGERTEGVCVLTLDTTAQRHLAVRALDTERLEGLAAVTRGVGRDLTDLLTVITLTAERSMQGPADQLPAGDLRRILEAARASARLVHELVGHVAATGERPEVDVHELVRTLLPLLQANVGDDVAIRVDLADAPARARIAAAPLEQVLVHLVDQARRAMGAVGQLTISTVVDAHAGPDGGTVTLALRDTGRAGTARTRALEPFLGDAGRAGVEVTTVAAAVRAAGGRVELLGDGTGTTVVLTLPLHPDATPGDPVPAPGIRRVLLVESADPLRSVLAQAISDSGYDVTATASHDEALALAGALPRVDVLVCDLVTPEGGGAELARALSVVHRGITTVYTSSHGPGVLDAYGVRPGSAPVLVKPFSASALVDAIEAALRPAR